MAIHANENLYPGINAHLNSYLQNEAGGWASFHAGHVTHISEILDNTLPDGYFTRSEKSLQITEFNPDERQSGQNWLKPDVTVYQNPQSQSSQSTIAEAIAPVNTIPIIETFPDEDELMSIVIYQAGEGSPLGRPITRIELLSPANKPNGSHYGQYTLKRMQTLKSGLRLVEIDYLHQSPPIIPNLADYSKGQDGAYPYTILVSDPRPTLEKGHTAIYGFFVKDPLPIIKIPLAGVDTVTINFGTIYNHTFTSSRFFKMIADYENLPMNFERYHDFDRTFIKNHLKTIRTKS